MTASRRPSTNSRVPSTGSMNTVMPEQTREARSSGRTKPSGSSSPSTTSERSTSVDGESSSPTIVRELPNAALRSFLSFETFYNPADLNPFQMISCALVSAKVSAVLGSVASFKTVPKASLPCITHSTIVRELRDRLSLSGLLHLPDRLTSSSGESEAS